MTAAIWETTKPRINQESAEETPTADRSNTSPDLGGAAEHVNADDVITSSDMVHQVLGLESSRPIFVTSEALQGTDVRGKDISNLWVATWDGDFVKVEEVLGEMMRGECAHVCFTRLAFDSTTIFSSDSLKKDALDFKLAVHEDWKKLFGYAPTFEIKRSYEEMVDNHQITGPALEEILSKLPDEKLTQMFGTNDRTTTTAQSDEESPSLQSSSDEGKTNPTPTAKKQPGMEPVENQYDNWPKREFTEKSGNLADESF